MAAVVYPSGVADSIHGTVFDVLRVCNALYMVAASIHDNGILECHFRPALKTSPILHQTLFVLRSSLRMFLCLQPPCAHQLSWNGWWALNGFQAAWEGQRLSRGVQLFQFGGTLIHCHSRLRWTWHCIFGHYCIMVAGQARYVVLIVYISQISFFPSGLA